MTELERAHEALREIAMLCGDPDPSDGEGTTPAAVVSMVGALSAERADLRSLLRYCFYHRDRLGFKLEEYIAEEDAEKWQQIFGKLKE